MPSDRTITRWADGGVTITQIGPTAREVTIRPANLPDIDAMLNVSVVRYEEGRQVAAGMNLTAAEVAELVAASCRLITSAASTGERH